MFENEEYEKLRLGFVNANKDFEDLTSEEFDLLDEMYDVGLEENNSHMETEEDYPLPDYDEDEERKLDLKRFYYAFCLEGAQNPGRVSVFLEHYYYDENLERDVRTKTTLCLNEETDEDKLAAFSMTIKLIEKKIIGAINFGCDWVDEGKPGVNEIEYLSKWVDNEDFYLFVQMLLSIEKLKCCRNDLQDKIERNKVEERKQNEFLFDSYAKKQIILDALEDLGITTNHICTLSSRNKSVLMGFVEGCLDKGILPEMPKKNLCSIIAKAINMKLTKHLNSGTSVGNNMKKRTKDYFEDEKDKRK